MVILFFGSTEIYDRSKGNNYIVIASIYYETVRKSEYVFVSLDMDLEVSTYQGMIFLF